MYKNIKKHLLLVLITLLAVFSITGCSKKPPKKFQTYVKSLISINYLGASKEYINATGADQAEAEALYESNIDLLTDNILDYYNISLSEDSAQRENFEKLAKNIYSHVNYKVSQPYKTGSVYSIDVTIYPINIFLQTRDDVIEYVNTFNTEVANGTYNDTEIAEYEETFSNGLLDILNEACNQMSYADPVTVTVVIQTEGNKFFLSKLDFLKIDEQMINSSIPKASAGSAE